MGRWLGRLAAGSGLLALAGCATPANHYDPLEPVNRKVYAFNNAIDKAVLKPVAKSYTAITPQPVQTGVSNFFGNLQDLYIGVSDALEGKFQDAGGDAGRLVVNSTFGLFGLIDVASPIGLKKHDADFGQVLGRWGVASGPYIVMPFLGPKTLRDSVDWVGSYYMDPLHKMHDTAWRNSLQGMRLIDTRARLLAAEKIIGEANFGDEYSFIRDSYLQRRYGLIYDGAPPKPLKLGDDDDDIGLDSLGLDGKSDTNASDKPSSGSSPQTPAPPPQGDASKPAETGDK